MYVLGAVSGDGGPDDQGRPDAGRALQDRVRERPGRHRGREPGQAGRRWPVSRSRSCASASSRGSSSPGTRARSSSGSARCCSSGAPPSSSSSPVAGPGRSSGGDPTAAPTSTSGRSSGTTSASRPNSGASAAEIELALDGPAQPRKGWVTRCSRCPSTASSRRSCRSPWRWAATPSPSRRASSPTADDVRGSRRRRRHDHDGRAAASTGIGLGTYGTLITWLAFAFLTASLIFRTIAVGHGPFANMYEFSVAFAWGTLGMYLYFERRYHQRVLGLIALPDRPAPPPVRGDDHGRLHRPARPGAPEQPPAVRPRRGRDRRLRHVHGRLRRAPSCT